MTGTISFLMVNSNPDALGSPAYESVCPTTILATETLSLDAQRGSFQDWTAANDGGPTQ